MHTCSSDCVRVARCSLIHNSRLPTLHAYCGGSAEVQANQRVISCFCHVERKRLEQALSRIEPAAARDAALDRLLRVVERTSPSFRRIPVRTGARIALVEPASIIFCRAEDKYAVIYTAEGEHVADRSIDDLERTLDPETFLRVHRSTIVNLAFVQELTSIEGGRFVISLKNPARSQVYASRAGARALREKLGI